jgi:hypothetical protein
MNTTKETNKYFDRSKATSLEKINEIINKVEDKTKINKKNLIAILSSSFVLIWFGIFDVYISYLLTVFYPVKWSLKVIGKKEMDGDKQWLSYWLIFSIFVFLDLFAEYIIVVIPFYFVIRTLILLWCYMPGLKGALVVYNVGILKLAKFSRTWKFFEKNKKYTLKSEVEQILETTEEKERESDITFPNFETNISKKIN